MPQLCLLHFRTIAHGRRGHGWCRPGTFSECLDRSEGCQLEAQGSSSSGGGSEREHWGNRGSPTARGHPPACRSIPAPESKCYVPVGGLVAADLPVTPGAMLVHLSQSSMPGSLSPQEMGIVVGHKSGGSSKGQGV